MLTAKRVGWYIAYAAAGVLTLYFVSCAAVGTYRDGAIAARCVTLGYSSHRSNYDPLTLRFQGYCVKRVDGTDVVVSLQEAEKR